MITLSFASLMKRPRYDIYMPCGEAWLLSVGSDHSVRCIRHLSHTHTHPPRSRSSPSCEELLDIVRKHWDAGPAMERRYWREMVDMLFVRGSRKGESSLQSQRDGLFDDMLFFVRQAEEVSSIFQRTERRHVARRGASKLSSLMRVAGTG